MNNTLIIFALTMAIILLLAGLTPPIQQNPAYHNLADQRIWLGIPNFMDVFSNMPFAIIGIIGIQQSHFRHFIPAWWGFFYGLILLSLGSTYYHLAPDNQTLFWDRMPMTISFMSLFAALIYENITPRFEKTILATAIILGLASVLYWRISGDLRWYGLVQFGTLAAIPVIIWKFNNRAQDRRYLLFGLGFYLLAKALETADRWLFQVTGEFISGHTLKHLAAAAATFCVYRMLLAREQHSV